MRSDWIQKLAFLLVLGALLFAAMGCASEPEGAQGERLPEVKTTADSVAMQLVEGLGGLEAWRAVPHLRFNFGIERNGEKQVVARHLWNRQSGEYRLEWNAGPDSAFVALFNVSAFGENAARKASAEAGQVYLNGEALDASASAQRMQEAHQRFVNDTYWLAAPLKVFDPGVNRAYVPDSSNTEHDVITLTFGEVGLTPGDQYWMYVSKETGRLDRWAYHLQNMPDEASPQFFNWTGYETNDTPAGPIQLAARKESAGGPAAILTNAIDVMDTVPEGMYSDPQPRLQ